MNANRKIASKTRHLPEDVSPPPGGAPLKRCSKIKMGAIKIRRFWVPVKARLLSQSSYGPSLHLQTDTLAYSMCLFMYKYIK